VRSPKRGAAVAHGRGEVENHRCKQNVATSGRRDSGRSAKVQQNLPKKKCLATSQRRIERCRALGDKLQVEGKMVQAEKAYRAAISLSGPWTERTLASSVFFNYAVCLITQERYDEAAAHAENAARLEPTFANAHYALGFATYRGGVDTQLAMRHFTNVMRVNAKVRVTLPNGDLFGPKGCPTLSPSDMLRIFVRDSRNVCAGLPPNWVARESRSQPGKVFFENIVTRTTTWTKPVDTTSSTRTACPQVEWKHHSTPPRGHGCSIPAADRRS
jgi:tetratricopeptide (TPR) repeat protein